LWNLQIPVPPLAVQKQIMERVAAGREEIAREREAAARLVCHINAETDVDRWYLGSKFKRIGKSGNYRGFRGSSIILGWQ
jgi:hypothetical protein